MAPREDIKYVAQFHLALLVYGLMSFLAMSLFSAESFPTTQKALAVALAGGFLGYAVRWALSRYTSVVVFDTIDEALMLVLGSLLGIISVMFSLLVLMVVSLKEALTRDRSSQEDELSELHASIEEGNDDTETDIDLEQHIDDLQAAIEDVQDEVEASSQRLEDRIDDLEDLIRDQAKSQESGTADETTEKSKPDRSYDSDAPTVNRSADDLNQGIEDEKGRDDYKIPILVSLIELGQDQYWMPEDIQDHWRGKYLELNEDDLKYEKAGKGERQVYKNRHAWALVDLQREDLITKHGNIREYKITEKGIRHLVDENIIEERTS